MSEDVKAAAERYGRGVYLEPERYEEDLHTLVRVYLAEHPADDTEPVTEEWLRSMGFTERDDWFDGLVNPDVQRIAIERDGSVHLFDSEAGLKDFAKAKTRGEVRRLCAALQIPLTESANS